MLSRRWRRFALLPLLVALSGCGGCDPLGLAPVAVELRNAVDSLDRAIDSLAQESADWQVVLADLETQLVADVRSTLRAEATDLVRNGIQDAGLELRCNSEYLARRAAQELTRLRNDLARQFNELPDRARGGPGLDLKAEPEDEPFVCTAVPSAVDLQLAVERRPKLDVYGFGLLSRPITAEVVDTAGSRRNVTAGLGVLGDFHMVLDLTEGGAAPEAPDARVVFSWDKESRSVVPILATTRERTCTTRTVVVPGVPHTFTPDHDRGDRDFSGHGPCVRLRADLELDAEARRLEAEIDLTARECDGSEVSQSDYTRASGETTIEVFEVTDPGERILSFDLDPRFRDSYRDSDHEDDLRTFGGTALFEKVRYVGDTFGDEAGDRTGAEMFFRRLEIQVERCTDATRPG